MENQEKKSGWRIWLYLTPVYLLLAWPLYRWSQNMRGGDLNISEEDYNAFASSEGEIKKRADFVDPQFADGVLRVRYRSGGEVGSAETDETSEREAAARETAAGGRKAAKKAESAQAGGRQLTPEQEDIKRREQMTVGNKQGYLTYAVGKAMNNPKAVQALLNNKYVVSGFMARGTVKQATSSPEALKAYLKGSGPANFINNPVVKAALNNPAVLSAMASSGMIGAMLDTPAAKALMSDPAAVADLVASNPELMNLAMQDPQLLSMLMSNPDVSGLLGKFDTSKVKTPF